MRSHVFDLLIKRRLGDGAFLDVDDQPVVSANEANIETLFEFVPLAANHDAIAVAVRLRAREDRRDDCRVKTANALEKIADLFVLELQLRWIREVLILAAAAIAEIAASGLNALGRGLKHSDQPGARKAFFNFGDLRLDSFAAGDERDEDHKIFHSPDAFAAKSSVANRQSQFIANSRTHCNRIGGRGWGGKEILRRNPGEIPNSKTRAEKPQTQNPN